MTANVKLPLVPMRKTANETSEMTSQLLFGDQVEILEITENCFLVRNKSDKYEGWVTRKMIEIDASNVPENTIATTTYRVITALSTLINTDNDSRIILPGASVLGNLSDNKLKIKNEFFNVNPSEISNSSTLNKNSITLFSKQYINSPYLWGGKSVLGIDCSGLVQVVFSMCGIQLPRDASQQVEIGKTIDFLTEAEEGDLAFFVNTEGKIIHVGILLNSSQIIHASGWVKIENIDATGILSSQTGEYTHFLKTIKRLI